MPDKPVSPGPAYERPSFLASEEARPLRILAEYLDPLARFQRAGVHDTIVFFGSARLQDLDLFQFADEPAAALRMIKERLTAAPAQGEPAFAHSRHREPGGA